MINYLLNYCLFIENSEILRKLNDNRTIVKCYNFDNS